MDSVPLFPQFRKISLDDKYWYDEFYRDFDVYADFCFQNLIIWLNQRDDLELSNLYGNIVIRFTDSFWLTDRSTQTYSLLGRNKINETLFEVFMFQRSIGITPTVEMVPATVFKSLAATNSLKIVEDRENAEYVIDATMLSTMEGPSLRSFREDCRSFIKKHGEHTQVKCLDASDPSIIRLLINSFHTWDNAYRHNDLDRHEAITINNIFQYAEPLSYSALAIYVKDKLESFVLFHAVPQAEWLMPNCIKVSYQYQDLYDYTVHEFAKYTTEQGKQFMNFEQDLGMPGLRHYKESLRPVRFLNKYTISPLSL